jgi:hypothetical protein
MSCKWVSIRIEFFLHHLPVPPAMTKESKKLKITKWLLWKQHELKMLFKISTKSLPGILGLNAVINKIQII